MSKRATALPLTLPPRDADTRAKRWLYGALADQILAGRLRPGSRLPGTRELAEQYRLSRGTVVSAFDQLAAEGYVEGIVGSGTHVSRVLPEELLQVERAATAGVTPGRGLRRTLSGYA